MVTGIDSFKEWFKGSEEQYAIIGGTAFRHCNNRKWFALIMDVPKNKLGLQGEEMLKVVDFKCDPILIGTLREEPGFFPAYHMSKDSWITVALDGSVSDDKTKMLLDMSYASLTRTTLFASS